MNINIDLSQKQITTQYMIQYMNLLQMSHMELENFLEEKALENPVIEFEKNTYSNDFSYSKKASHTQTDSDENFTSNDWEDKRESEERLSDHLLSQLTPGRYNAQDMSILTYLVHSLDHRGYYTENPEIAASIFSTDCVHILKLLQVIQSLSPSGIGARNLSECLMLQIKALDINNPTLERIVKEHLTSLSTNHLDKIAHNLGISVGQIKEASKIIKKLNPKPGSYFSNREYVPFVTPDIYIKRDKFNLNIILSEQQGFNFSINTYYQNLKNLTKDAETRSYLQQKIQQAEWISDSIRQRSDTILQVVKEITEIQKDFFLCGPGYKRPMKLSDLADELDLNSTVSSYNTGRYLHFKNSCHISCHIIEKILDFSRDF